MEPRWFTTFGPLEQRRADHHHHESGRRFDLVGIFRDESVAPTFGYSFDPIQMRRLFATGVSDARQRCVELAFFLGMGDAVDQLDQWCNESPKFEPLLCEPTSQDYKTCPGHPENTPIVP